MVVDKTMKEKNPLLVLSRHLSPGEWNIRLLPARNEFLQGEREIRHTIPFLEACRLALGRVWNFPDKPYKHSQNWKYSPDSECIYTVSPGNTTLSAQSQTARVGKRKSVPNSSYTPNEFVRRWQKPNIPFFGLRMMAKEKKRRSDFSNIYNFPS